MVRDRSVIFRLTHEEYSAMEAAAGARGVSRSELIRGAVLREIGDGSLEERVACLERNFDKFFRGEAIDPYDFPGVAEAWQDYERKRAAASTERRRA